MEEINKFLEYKIPSIDFWTNKSPFKLILNVYFSICTRYDGIEIVIISCKENNKIRNALYDKMRNIHDSNKTNKQYGTIIRHCCIRGCYIISKRNYITNCNIQSFAKKTAQITIDNVGYKQFTIGSKYCIVGKTDMNYFPKVRISKIQEIKIKNTSKVPKILKFNSLNQRKETFMNFSKDIRDLYNLYNPINWIQMKYLEKKYGDSYSKKLEYLGIKYINPGYDDNDEYIDKYGPKQIDAFRKAIDILHMHRYFCISKNCFTCNAIYIATRKMIEKTDDTLSYLTNLLIKKL